MHKNLTEELKDIKALQTLESGRIDALENISKLPTETTKLIDDRSVRNEWGTKQTKSKLVNKSWNHENDKATLKKLKKKTTQWSESESIFCWL